MLCPGGKSLFGQSIPASRPGGEGCGRADWQLGHAIGIILTFQTPGCFAQSRNIATLRYWYVLICNPMQKYAVYSTLIQRFPSSWSFQFFLRYCKDPDAEKRKASPCRFHAIYRTASGLQTSGGRFAGVSGTLCGHGISCNTVGNLEWAPFSACSIFWLISARYDSFVHIRSKNRHVWFPDGEFYCFRWVFVFIFQENTLRCFASKCAKWKDTSPFLDSR